MSAAPSSQAPDPGQFGRDPFSVEGGELGWLIRRQDWEPSAVGPIDTWPQSLKTIVEIMLGSRYAMWMAWGEHLTVFYNDAYRPTLGVKHPWALGASARVVWREIWPEIGPRIEHVLATGKATYDEGLRLMLERSGFPEETFHTFSYSPIPDGQGGFGGMLCVVTEDTRRVIGERRLALLRELAASTAGIRSTETYFRALGGFLGSGVPDLPFALVYLAEAEGGAVHLAGGSGVTPGHPAAPQDGACWPLADVLTGGRPVVLESSTCPLLPTGPWDRPPSHVVLLPIAQQGHAAPAGVIVAGLNPYRPFDDEYRGFIDLFAGQVTAGIADARAYEEERRRAEALAELDRAKTAFFSNVSHEFRTPLTLMLSPVEELLAAPVDAMPPHARALLQTAARNGLRLLRLVNALLDFSRVEAGRVQASYEPVDLAGFTAELAGNFRSACERAGIGFTVDCPPLPAGAPVYVDRDMWEKIVLNLISNAFKFTNEGHIAVRLRAAGPMVELVVEDSGIGIPPAELPRLFERFHRVEGARGRTMEGSGIGLALVQELVKLHGGSISIESTPGQGSTFTVAIPFGSAHLRQEQIGAARGLASTATRADAFVEEALRWLDAAPPPEPQPVLPQAGPRPRVLLADDNADMRDYIRRLLAPHYEVLAVADGAAALEAARTERPELVLTDVMMPVMDGFALLRALRQDRALRELPVIMLSARAGEEAQIEGLDAGADDYLAKPFSARELLARVRTNLDLARQRREANAEAAAWRDRYEVAVRASGHILFDWNVETDAILLGAGLEAITGYTSAELPDITSWIRLIPLADHPKVEAEVARVRHDGEAYRLDHRLIRKDGMVLEIAMEGQFVRDLAGEGGRHMVGFARDVTEQRRAQAHQRLLLDELNHRVKNTLAAVQSIAHQTLRGPGTVEELGAIFVDRLMGLSKTHNLLTAARWEGASLRDVALAELGPFQDSTAGRVRLDGPEVRLGPKAALALGMAFHELATNAAKYGALSDPGGRVALTWRADALGAENRALHLLWEETGGPPVHAPARRGFGSRLVERGLARELRGTVHLDFAPQGVRCTIEFPLATMEAPA
jgi:PAS domain S-box-containing protein